MLGGVIGGTALTLGVVLAHTDKGPPVGELLIGPAVIVVGLAAGIGLLVASVDHAKLELLPGLPSVATLAPAPSQRELAQGATLRLRF